MEIKKIKSKFNIKDIIDTVYKCALNLEKSNGLENEYLLLKRNNLHDTCKAIFEFVHKRLKYEEDGDLYQLVQYPKPLLKNGFGDCKSYAVLCSHILQTLGHRHKIVFCNFKNAPAGSWHVFVMADNICLDPTQTNFNKLPENMKRIVTKAVGRGLQTMGAIPASNDLMALAKQIKMSGIGSNSPVTRQQVSRAALKVAEQAAKQQIEETAKINATLLFALLAGRGGQKAGVAPLAVVAAVKLAPVVIPAVMNFVNSAQNAKWAAQWGQLGKDIERLMNMGFDPADYISKNPDVQVAVTGSGTFLAEYGNDTNGRAAGHWVEAVWGKGELRYGGFPYLDFKMLAKNLATRYPEAKRAFIELESFPVDTKQLTNLNASPELKFLNVEWSKQGFDKYKAGDAAWQPFAGNETIQTSAVQPSGNLPVQAATMATGIAQQMEQRVPANFDLFAAGSWQQLSQALNLPERQAKQAVRLVQQFNRSCQRLATRILRDAPTDPMANWLAGRIRENVLLYVSGMPSAIPARYQNAGRGRPVSELAAAKRTYDRFIRNYAQAIAQLPGVQIASNIAAPGIAQSNVAQQFPHTAQQAAGPIVQVAQGIAGQMVQNPSQATQIAAGAINAFAPVVQQAINAGTGIKVPTVQDIKSLATPANIGSVIGIASSVVRPSASGGLTFDRGAAIQGGLQLGAALAQNLFIK